MSHRKHKSASAAPPSPTTRERAARGFRLFIAENVRAMLLMLGLVTFVQAVLPWTNSAGDRVVFGAAGAVMLGLALPRRLWVR